MMFKRENNDQEMKSFDIESNTDQTTAVPSVKSKFSSLFIIVPLVLMAGAIGYKYLRKDDTLVTADSETRFLELDEIMVNLRQGTENTSSWLRVKVSLEVHGKHNYDVASALKPKIVDVFHTYLKELRKVDLDGSFALYKIKDEMLLRINTIISPARIESICFQDFIMQVS